MHLQPLQDLRQLVGRKKAAFPPRGKCGLLLTQGRPHHAPPGRTHSKILGQRKKQLPGISVTDNRALPDLLPDLPPLQSEYHIIGSFKEPVAPFPAHAAFAML